MSGHQSRYTLHSLCDEEYIIPTGLLTVLYDSQWTEAREMMVPDVEMKNKTDDCPIPLTNGMLY